MVNFRILQPMQRYWIRIKLRKRRVITKSKLKLLSHIFNGGTLNSEGISNQERTKGINFDFCLKFKQIYILLSLLYPTKTPRNRCFSDVIKYNKRKLISSNLHEIEANFEQDP